MAKGIVRLFGSKPATRIVTDEQLEKIPVEDVLKVEHLKNGTMRVTLGNLHKYGYLPFG